MYSSSSFLNSTFHLVPLPSILYGPFLPHIIFKIDSSVSSSSSLFFVSSCSSELFSSDFFNYSSLICSSFSVLFLSDLFNISSYSSLFISNLLFYLYFSIFYCFYYFFILYIY